MNKDTSQVEKNVGIFSFYKTMLHYQTKYPLFISLLLLSIAMSILYECIVPLVFKWMFDKVLYSHDMTLLIQATLLLSASFIFLILSSLIQIYASAKMGSKVIANMRFKMFHKIQRIKFLAQEEHFESDLLTRFTNDLSFVESMSVYMMWSGINSIAMGVFGLALLVYFDWIMTIIVAIMMPIALIAPRVFSKRSTQNLKEKKQLEMNLITYVQEAITMQDVVSLLLLRGYKLSQFKQRVIDSMGSSFKYSLFAGLTGRTSYFGLSLIRLIVLCGGGYFVILGQLTPGRLIGFLMLLGSINSAISSLMSLYPILNRSAESLSKVQELIDVDSQEPIDVLKSVPVLSDHIRFETVGFHYANNQILDNINVVIHKGMSIAFVGPSGAGKSTIIKLMLKEIIPTSGHIFFDQTDYSDISTRSLLSQTGVVMQQPKLFEASILENIRLGKLNATESEIIEAAKSAGIHEDIMRLPDQYNTVIGKRNAGLSGGQAQRLAIARALLSKPSILFLDEATSALDPFSGAAIDELLYSIAGKHTIISISHRLSSVVKADNIVVLDKGKIVESGVHEDLLRQEGLYQRLWQKQQGFILSPETKEISVIPEWLKNIPLFKTLDSETLAVLAHEFVVQRNAADEMIVKQGAPAEKFYIIVAGKVEVFTTTEDEEEHIQATLTDGDYFGEIALLFDTPRNASVRTKTISIFLTLHYHKFHNIYQKLPESIRATLLASAIQRFSPEQQKANPRPRFTHAEGT